MKKIFKKIVFASVAIVAAVPVLVSAAGAGTGFATPDVGGVPKGSIIDILTTGMNWLLTVVGILGVVGFVIAGIIYLTAAGDEGQIDKGKQAMVYSIVGVIVSLLGVVIINAVKSMLGGDNAAF